MHVIRYPDAIPYEAPGHHNMTMLRLQGREAGPSETMWLGMSHLAPGARIEASSAPEERFYLVLEGEIEVSNGVETCVLGKWDTCRIGPNETRMVRNTTQSPAVTVLAMAQPQKR
ncbi:Cupin 2, conserved barrel [Rhabdaerophilaceae bacterium]